MSIFLVVAFAVSAANAVLGNFAVYVVLVRRHVPTRFMWSGTPGYLYRVCVNATPPASRLLQRFAFSTNVAFVVAILSGVFLGAANHI